MALTGFFYAYSALLPLLPLGCLFYFILQAIIAIKGHRKFSDKKLLFFLFLTYTSAFLCGLTGYSMHIIPSNSVWCEKYGIGFCFSFLGGTKAALYCVFLRRAKSTAVQQFNSSKLKERIFNYVIPCYILVYYLMYCVLTTYFFKGQYYELPNMEHININSTQISFCAFKTWESRFVIICSVIDLMNSIIATLAFVIPLYKILKLTNIPDREITNAMKWDVILTFTATISSAITLCMLNPMTGGWMWCFCLVDPFINSSCCFFMMAINREFVVKCNSVSVKHTNMMELSIAQSKQNNVSKITNTIPDTQSSSSPSTTIPASQNTVVVVLHDDLTTGTDLVEEK